MDFHQPINAAIMFLGRNILSTHEFQISNFTNLLVGIDCVCIFGMAQISIIVNKYILDMFCSMQPLSWTTIAHVRNTSSFNELTTHHLVDRNFGESANNVM